MKMVGHQLNGIFHSHPTAPPIPSNDDILNAHYPEATYFIISLLKKTPEVRCYSFRDSRVIPMKFIIV